MIRHRDRHDNGMTLVEMMISIALLAVIFGFFTSLVTDTRRFANFADTQIVLERRCSKILSGIRENLLQSKEIMERGSVWDPLVNPAITTIATCSMPANVGNSRLPDVGGTTGQETFGVDGTTDGTETHSAKTGNCLFFIVREKVKCQAGVDAASAPVIYDLDLYRFVAYYPHRVAGTSNLGTSYRLQLVQWQSILYADYNQIEAINNNPHPDIADTYLRVLSVLYNKKGVQYLLRVGEDPNNAFYQIITDGVPAPGAASTGYSSTADSAYRIEHNTTADGLKTMVDFSSALSLGMNEAETNPKPTKYTAANGQFPGGFEVQVIGSSVHNVLLRVMLQKKISTNPAIGKAFEVIVKTSVY